MEYASGGVSRRMGVSVVPVAVILLSLCLPEGLFGPLQNAGKAIDLSFEF